MIRSYLGLSVGLVRRSLFSVAGQGRERRGACARDADELGRASSDQAGRARFEREEDLVVCLAALLERLGLLLLVARTRLSYDSWRHSA
jgi:hypothetical protein